MSRSLEDVFSRWAQPPGKTEGQRIENAVGAIRNAISSSAKLKGRATKVFVQGSYRNRVNVRADSDVDIGVLCHEVFFADYPEGKCDADFGHYDHPYSYRQFKNEVGEALESYFGPDAVCRGNKAFDLHENTYRVDADVTALFEYREYWPNGTYRTGVALVPDRGGRIENYPERLLDDWPRQPLHYENGVAKNQQTGRAFKGVTRIVKSLRNQMASEGLSVAEPVPGFLIECLVWNVPADRFTSGEWVSRVKMVLAYLWAGTQSDEACKDWCEVNNIKYLFRPTQPWTRTQAHRFIESAWAFLGWS